MEPLEEGSRGSSEHLTNIRKKLSNKKSFDLAKIRFVQRRARVRESER